MRWDVGVRKRVSRLARRVRMIWADRRARAAAVLTIGVAAVGALARVAWLWHRGPDLAPDTWSALGADGQVQAVGQYRTQLLQAAAAVGGAVTLVYTAYNYRLSRRGQTSDRFAKALERLGSPDLYVRIGAVYALEQVLRDSPEQHTDIVNVLVEFVRAHTRLTTPTRIRRDASTHHGVHAIILTALPDPADHPAQPQPNIHAALTVLGGRPTRGRPGNVLNLTGLHLTNAWLDGADLSNAWFDDADLTEAWLGQANLTGAAFGMTNLTGAKFVEANLTRADLVAADLTHTGFDDADLTGAKLAGADLTHARLGGANITRADLIGAKLNAEQANTAAHPDRAILPAHLMWDPELERVRDATTEETTATKTRHRETHRWL